MLKCAEQSPRICDDGTIRWYEGDTFNLEFDLTFTDEAGNELPVEANDKVSICFKNIANEIVYEYEVIGTNILNININEEVTKKFKIGDYRYCVRRNAQYITTVIHKNKVVVE